MHRIDGAGATVDNKFTEGDPAGGVQATVVTDDWLNDVQENLMAVLAAAGVPPTKGRANDLLDAVKGRLINVQKFSTAGTYTYTPTPGTASVVPEVQGAGGAGGGSQATSGTTVSVCPGGNAGAYGKSRLTTGFSGATIIVGAGGTGVVGANGNAGGTSSFGGAISAPGGQGGPTYGANPAPVLNINYSAQTASSGGNITNSSGGRGQPGIASGIAYGGSGDGGTSVFGSGGATAGVTGTPTNGKAGVSPGSGGSGGAGGNGAAASIGGAGAPGIVIVWEYA